MGMIFSTAGIALILGYRGLFNLCNARYPLGAIAIVIGSLLAAGSFLLCRHCNDLMDR